MSRRSTRRTRNNTGFQFDDETAQEILQWFEQDDWDIKKVMKSELVKSLGCFRADVQKLTDNYVEKHHQAVVDACRNNELDKLEDLCSDWKFKADFTVCAFLIVFGRY